MRFGYAWSMITAITVLIILPDGWLSIAVLPGVAVPHASLLIHALHGDIFWLLWLSLPSLVLLPTTNDNVLDVARS